MTTRRRLIDFKSEPLPQPGGELQNWGRGLVSALEANLEGIRQALTGVRRQFGLAVPAPVRTLSDSTYTVQDVDEGYYLRFTASSPAVTIAPATIEDWEDGAEVEITHRGSGTLSITTTGLTINGAPPSLSGDDSARFKKVGTAEMDYIG